MVSVNGIFCNSLFSVLHARVPTAKFSYGEMSYGKVCHGKTYHGEKYGMVSDINFNGRKNAGYISYVFEYIKVIKCG